MGPRRQYDTPESVDFEHLVREARLYALMLLQADEDLDGILDYRTPARHLTRVAERLGPQGHGLRAAAKRHGELAHGRRAFTRVGRGLYAVHARGCGYPHEQAAADVDHLEAAIQSLRRGDRQHAIRRLSAIGDNRLARYLSEEALALRVSRRRPPADSRTWSVHRTTSPGLWAELASLRGEPGAREVGAWLDRSLERHLKRSRAEIVRHTQAMEDALNGPL